MENTNYAGHNVRRSQVTKWFALQVNDGSLFSKKCMKWGLSDPLTYRRQQSSNGRSRTHLLALIFPTS